MVSAGGVSSWGPTRPDGLHVWHTTREDGEQASFMAPRDEDWTVLFYLARRLWEGVDPAEEPYEDLVG